MFKTSLVSWLCSWGLLRDFLWEWVDLSLQLLSMWTCHGCRTGWRHVGVQVRVASWNWGRESTEHHQATIQVLLWRWGSGASHKDFSWYCHFLPREYLFVCFSMEKSKFVLHLFTSKLTKTRSAAKQKADADLQIHFKKASLFTKYPKHICCSQALPCHGYTMDINGYCQALQLRLKDLGHEDGSRARWDAIGQIDWINVKSQRPTTSLQLFECWISADVFFDCHFWNVAFRDFSNWLNVQPPQSWKESPCKVETWRRCKSSSAGLDHVQSVQANRNC